MTQMIKPKQRISSIDALRGFSLIGIVLLHCMFLYRYGGYNFFLYLIAFAGIR